MKSMELGTQRMRLAAKRQSGMDGYPRLSRRTVFRSAFD